MDVFDSELCDVGCFRCAAMWLWAFLICNVVVLYGFDVEFCDFLVFPIRSFVISDGFDVEFCDVGRFRCGALWFWMVSMWSSVTLGMFVSELCDVVWFRCGAL